MRVTLTVDQRLAELRVPEDLARMVFEPVANQHRPVVRLRVPDARSREFTDGAQGVGKLAFIRIQREQGLAQLTPLDFDCPQSKTFRALWERFIGCHFLAFIG